MLIDGAYTNLMQGVSQQPDRSRLPGQCTAMLNMLADPIDGLKRRPPATHIASTGVYNVNNLAYGYNTGAERYHVIFGADKTVQVFDWDGVQKTVNNQGTLYLPTTPKANLRIATVGDYTIVANNVKVTALTADVSTAAHGALVYIKSGDFAQAFNIALDGIIVANYVTSPTEVGSISPDNIAVELYNDLITAAPAGYIFGIFSNIITVKKTSAVGLIDITCVDSRNGTAGVVIQDRVKDTSELPRIAITGMRVAVTGSGTKDEDDLYFTADGSGGLTRVVWRETLKTGLKYKFDAATMPHVLVRLADGTFYFGPLNGGTYGGTVLESWVDRDAGDDNSNPERIFIGSTIEFISSFQDRLLFLSGEFLILSSTKSYFNFWNTTGSTLLDSDPIEIANPSTQATPLKSVVMHNKNLIVFSLIAQFMLPGGSGLTPALAALRQITAYQSSLGAVPVVAGSNVMFDITYGKYSGVRELYTASLVDMQEARAITEHVKRYIPGKITRMQVGSNLGILGVLTDGAPNSIFIYQYIWEGEQRVQAAWSEWRFKAPVVNFFFDGATIALLMVDSTNAKYSLCELDSTDVSDAGLTYNVYLDRKQMITPAGNLQFSIAESPAVMSDLIVVQSENCLHPGLTVQVASIVGTTVTLAEDPGGAVIFGYKYDSVYTPTMPIMRDQNGIAIETNRLIVGAFNITYKDSGAFRVNVTDPWNGVSTQEFSGRYAGDVNTIVGTIPIISGLFNASIGKDRNLATIDIASEKHLPMKITGIEWTGQFTKKGRRF